MNENYQDSWISLIALTNITIVDYNNAKQSVLF